MSYFRVRGYYCLCYSRGHEVGQSEEVWALPAPVMGSAAIWRFEYRRFYLGKLIWPWPLTVDYGWRVD